MRPRAVGAQKSDRGRAAMHDEAVVRTSDLDWVDTVAASYRRREALTIIDDAELGVTPAAKRLQLWGVRLA